MPANWVYLNAHLLGILVRAGIQFNEPAALACAALISARPLCAALRTSSGPLVGHWRSLARLHTSTKDLSRSHRPVRRRKQTTQLPSHRRRSTWEKPPSHGRHTTAGGFRSDFRQLPRAKEVHWAPRATPDLLPAIFPLNRPPAAPTQKSAPGSRDSAVMWADLRAMSIMIRQQPYYPNRLRVGIPALLYAHMKYNATAQSQYDNQTPARRCMVQTQGSARRK